MLAAMTAAQPDKIPHLELPDGTEIPTAPARAKLTAVLTPERMRTVAPLVAALGVGLFLGIRLGQHLAKLGTTPLASTADAGAGADVIPGWTPRGRSFTPDFEPHNEVPAPYEGPSIVVQPQHARTAVPCVECAQRTRAAHEANLAALRTHPLDPATAIFQGLTPEDQAALEARLAEAQAPAGEELITVGQAPPIHDVPA
jgi:hypothetical protein